MEEEEVIIPAKEQWLLPIIRTDSCGMIVKGMVSLTALMLNLLGDKKPNIPVLKDHFCAGYTPAGICQYVILYGFVSGNMILILCLLADALPRFQFTSLRK